MRLDLPIYAMVPNGKDSLRRDTVFTLKTLDSGKFYVIEGTHRICHIKKYFHLTIGDKWKQYQYVRAFDVDSIGDNGWHSATCFGISNVLLNLTNFTSYREFKIHEFEDKEEFESLLVMKELSE